jgi:hypothetical protein
MIFYGGRRPARDGECEGGTGLLVRMVEREGEKEKE